MDYLGSVNISWTQQGLEAKIDQFPVCVYDLFAVRASIFFRDIL